LPYWTCIRGGGGGSGKLSNLSEEKIAGGRRFGDISGKNVPKGVQVEKSSGENQAKIGVWERTGSLDREGEDRIRGRGKNT